MIWPSDAEIQKLDLMPDFHEIWNALHHPELLKYNKNTIACPSDLGVRILEKLSRKSIHQAIGPNPTLEYILGC